MTAARTTKYREHVASLLEKLGAEGVAKLEAMPVAELRKFAGVTRKPTRRRKARSRRAG